MHGTDYCELTDLRTAPSKGVGRYTGPLPIPKHPTQKRNSSVSFLATVLVFRQRFGDAGAIPAPRHVVANDKKNSDKSL